MLFASLAWALAIESIVAFAATCFAAAAAWLQAARSEGSCRQQAHLGHIGPMRGSPLAKTNRDGPEFRKKARLWLAAAFSPSPPGRPPGPRSRKRTPGALNAARHPPQAHGGWPYRLPTVVHEVQGDTRQLFSFPPDRNAPVDPFVESVSRQSFVWAGSR